MFASSDQNDFTGNNLVSIFRIQRKEDPRENPPGKGEMESATKSKSPAILTLSGFVEQKVLF